MLRAGSRQMAVGTETVLMDVALVARDGVLYVPMRWAAEALGYRVAGDLGSWTTSFAGN